MSNSRKKKILNHLSKVSMSLLSVSLLLGSSRAASAAIDSADAASQVVAADGGKEAINALLKVGRSKPAMSLAASITCLACAPVVGATVSPMLCVTCGILLSKTFG